MVKQKGEKKKSKKEKKEGPKKAWSAFIHYSASRRKSLKTEETDLKITEASVKIGLEWKKMSESDKEPFFQLAFEDKARYEKEKNDLLEASIKKFVNDDETE